MGNDRIGIEAGPLTINRQDYHLLVNDKLDGGGLVVSDDIVINLSADETSAPPGYADETSALPGYADETSALPG
jgi:hypothetical protein